ncbi:MAG: hypothetical protein ACRDZO_08665 [Egibacteraceae bacterium]
MGRGGPGFPYEFPRSDMGRDVVHRNTAHLIDDHRGQYPFARHDPSEISDMS